MLKLQQTSQSSRLKLKKTWLNRPDYYKEYENRLFIYNKREQENVQNVYELMVLYSF